MPGYDVDRFVNMTEKEKSELSCSICHEILKNPLVTNCCLQTFCHDCIGHWLRNNNTCPYDRRPLTIDRLRPPPRLLTNLLGKLEIRCDYKDKGCQQILTLDTLTQHKMTCAFNVQTCNSCSGVLRSGHNCIRELLVFKNRLIEENDILKAEKQSLEQNIRENDVKYKREIEGLRNEKESTVKGWEESDDQFNEEIHRLKTENKKINEMSEKSKQEINDLKSENDKLMKTLKQMTENKDKNASFGSTSSMSSDEQNSFRDMISESRKHMKKPMITESNSSPEMSERIVAIVCNELRNTDNMFTICKNIVYKCDEEFGTNWYCLANYIRNGQNFCHHSSCFIKIKFGSLLFKIFRTKFLDISVLRRRIGSGKIRRIIKVLETDMSLNMVSDVELITFNSLDKCDNLRDISSKIQMEMEKKYSGHWMCFLYNFGDQSVHKKEKKFISFEFAEMKVILLQTK